jgi:hypothetical protein
MGRSFPCSTHIRWRHVYGTYEKGKLDFANEKEGDKNIEY